MVSVLEHLGGAEERVLAMTAEDIVRVRPALSEFNTLAIDCAWDGPILSPMPGLPDEAFHHDGQLTKREVRAVTLSLLSPYPNALLWDVGAGCGSIAIEWMRSGMGTQAIAIEAKSERVAMIRANAEGLGTPDLQIVEAGAPEGLEGLDRPDVVFVGGGLTNAGLFEACWEALAPGGRLVANAVTIEGEARLVHLHSQYGGELTRVSVARAASVGRYFGWKSLMPVTIWAVTKEANQ